MIKQRSNAMPAVAFWDGLGIFQMKRYSIVRAGSEYIVQVGEKSIMRVSSRRKAVKLVNDAAGLLDQTPAPSPGEPPSIACDHPEVP